MACERGKDGGGKVLAKIGGKNFTQGDFEFMLKTLSPDRQEELLKDPEARRKHFDFLLKQRLQALAAQKSKYGKAGGLSERQALIDQRIVTQNYYQGYLGENGGHTDEELQQFYAAHSSMFADDSGKARPFAEVKARVADSLILSKAPLDSFYRANGKRYEKKASCDVYMIQARDRKQADEASKALAGGTSFAEAAGKWSIHASSKSAGGKAGTVVQGESMWELQPLNQDSLFFNAESGLKPGAVSAPLKKDSTWLIVKADACQPRRIPDLAEARSQVAGDYLSNYKTKLADNALAELKKKYGVKIVDRNADATDADLRKYYEANKDNYLAGETFEVYHVESKNKDQLAKRAQGVADLEAFKKLASEISENAWTKPAQGLVGVIKRDNSLPAGIGMLPGLFPVLDTMESGLVADPIQNPDTKKWHVFWLARKFPQQPKAFDRVKALVKQDMKADAVKTVKPEDVLAEYDGGGVIREKDVLFLREEIPAHLQERYTRESLVDFLLTWELATRESDALGLTKQPKLQAQRLDNKTNFWAQVYQDSVLSRNYGMDTATLKRTFAEKRAFLARDTAETDWKKYVRDIAGLLALDPKELDIEYRTNPERYRRDTVALSFEESRYDVYQNLKGVAYAEAEEKLIDRLEREFEVVIVDATLLPPKITNPQETYKTAQNLHYDRKLDQALELYGRLREQFPKMESLQDSICFGTAQIYIEQEKYQQALAEYRRVSYLYPKSPNDYKAMFMVGFIHAEHLKNDSAAVRAFEQMLAKYPSSDLSDDADWMIRNIRSGGKLMPVLEGDSSWVEPDSTAAQEASSGSTKQTGNVAASEPVKSGSAAKKPEAAKPAAAKTEAPKTATAGAKPAAAPSKVQDSVAATAESAEAGQ
jgi:hypothetical protein